MLFEEWIILKTQIKELQASSQKVDVSQELISLLIFAEDHRFNVHSGVDLLSLARATWKIARGTNIEGGSTIAMQLVRVLTGRYQRTITRKLVEIIFAIGVTRLIGKDEIPKLYLMVAYYGWRMNGLQQAAARLSFDPKSIPSRQAAELIARLKYPEPQHPSVNRLEQIRNRANHILHRRRYFSKNSEK